MVLVPAGADDTDYTLAVMISQTVVGAVTAATRNLLNIGRLSTLPLPIEIY